MSRFFKLENTAESRFVSDASLSTEATRMLLLYPQLSLSISMSTRDDFLDYKAHMFVQENNCQKVDMTTHSGLPVLFVCLPLTDDLDASCHYVVLEDGHWRLMITTQRLLFEGEI